MFMLAVIAVERDITGNLMRYKTQLCVKSTDNMKSDYSEIRLFLIIAIERLNDFHTQREYMNRYSLPLISLCSYNIRNSSMRV